MAGDTLALADETAAGTPLLGPSMRGGRRVRPPEGLAEIRERASKGLGALPRALRSLQPAPAYAVEVSQQLEDAAARIDRET
jgi:nicotinate phosphoribosyltransferase